MGWWQSRNWDPEVGYPDFDYYCANVSSDKVLYPDTEALRSTAQKLIKIGGWGSQVDILTNRLLNYIGYVNLTAAVPCLEGGSTLDECYSAYNAANWESTDLSAWDSRSWTWQYW